MKINIIGTVGVIIGMLFLTYLFYTSIKNLKKEYKSNIEAMSDTLEVWKDKDGKNIAKIKSLEFDNTKSFAKLYIKDSQLKELQEEVKKVRSKLKKQGSVNIVETNTKIDTVFETIVTSGGSFVTKVGLDNWVTGIIKTDSISSRINLSINNKYSVVVGSERKNIFSKRIPFAMIKNYNPYTTTQSLRTYQVKLPKPKRFYIGPFVGYNGSFVYGVGVGYGLIRL